MSGQIGGTRFLCSSSSPGGCKYSSRNNVSWPAPFDEDGGAPPVTLHGLGMAYAFAFNGGYTPVTIPRIGVTAGTYLFGDGEFRVLPPPFSSPFPLCNCGFSSTSNVSYLPSGTFAPRFPAASPASPSSDISNSIYAFQDPEPAPEAAPEPARPRPALTSRTSVALTPASLGFNRRR
jgi:hypothetical protein